MIQEVVCSLGSMSNFDFCFVNIISRYFSIYEYFFSFLKKKKKQTTTPPKIQWLEVSRQSPSGIRTIHPGLRDTCYIWAAYPSFSIEICFIKTEILVKSDFLILCVLYFTAECGGRKALNSECASLVHDSGHWTWSQWDFISPAVHTFRFPANSQYFISFSSLKLMVLLFVLLRN